MTINYTTLLALGQPVTGTESGTWGDDVNNAITAYLDAAIAGTQTISTDADVTLTLTQGTNLATNLGSTSAQYATLLCSGARTAARNVTVPASSRQYVIINSTTGGFAVTLRGAGPTTGVSIANGERAFVVWNGSDYVKVATSVATAAGSNTQVQYNSSGTFAGSANLTFDGTTLTAAALAGPHNGTVGATTPASGAFTTLSASSTVSGTGFSTYLASPPAIGGTTPAAGTFTTISSTSEVVTGASGITTRAAATQDGVALVGRAGGTGSFAVTFTPTTLTANRTLTLPDASGTILQSGTAVTVAQGGLGLTSIAALSIPVANTANTYTTVTPAAGQSVRINAGGTAWEAYTPSAGTGTVTSVAASFTGGLISLTGSPITTSGTLAFTVAGTSGGIPYFSAANTWASSAALTANALMVGGGAGAAPSTITTGTGVVTALGVAVGSAGAFVTNGGALGTPSSGTVTNLTGTASININGTVGATTPTTGAFTTVTASSTISDSIGDVRTIVQNARTAAYVLVASDAGKHISITTGGVTVNASIFSPGQAVTIFNNSAANQTITQGASVTMYLAGSATTGNRTLAQRGICTLLCIVGGATPTFVISGGGLT